MGSHLVLDVWRIALLCLMWNMSREQNARFFEDHERTKEGLKNILVKSLFNWIGVYTISHFSNLFEFVVFCSLAFNGGFFLYTFFVLGLRPFAFINEMSYLLKKKCFKIKKYVTFVKKFPLMRKAT